MSVQTSSQANADTGSAGGLYCYGVTWAKAAPPGREAGVGGEAVGLVADGDLAALTSRVASTSVRAKRRDLLNHSEVLAAALERGTVLPVRFGVVFESEAALVEDFLRPRRGELATLLRRFEGQVELTVRAHYEEDAILAEIVQEHPRIARLREETRHGPAAATYPLKVELGERVAAELQKRTNHDRRALLDRLRPLALDLDFDQEPIEHQVLRASFLVERRNVRAFDDAMDDLAREHAGRIRFKYVGPLAPHSFVSVPMPEAR
ncbi:MAG TPA: GvpL/GvpF family gas vesicle protein [Gaiellaceae bacterium]|nr:GvpL/GvpF family gas vesicle protein [Gaiellaceae bacterium]